MHLTARRFSPGLPTTSFFAMAMDAAQSDLLSSYPRRRPPLSPAWEDAYTDVYRSSRNGTTLLYGLTQKLESWMHRAVLPPNPPERILEIGAGTLNHLKYEDASVPYDVVEPFRALFEGSPQVGRVSNFYTDIAEVPASLRYDHVVSIATLEHLTDLPQVLARIGLMLSSGGRFSSAIPSEGGFLWGTTWRLSVGLACRLSRGLDYGELMRHEHVNEASEVLSLIRYLFRQVSVRRFPTPLHQFSLYTAIAASVPDLDACHRILEMEK